MNDMALGIELTELLGLDLDELGFVLPDPPEGAADFLYRAAARLKSEVHPFEIGSKKNDAAYDLAVYAGETRLRRATSS